MVCVPCILIPVILWIYFKFIVPLFSRLPLSWQQYLPGTSSSTSQPQMECGPDGCKLVRKPKCPIGTNSTSFHADGDGVVSADEIQAEKNKLFEMPVEDNDAGAGDMKKVN